MLLTAFEGIEALGLARLRNPTSALLPVLSVNHVINDYSHTLNMEQMLTNYICGAADS